MRDDVKSVGGFSTDIHWNNDGSADLQHKQDKSVIDKELQLFQHASEHYAKRNMRHAARVPLVLYWQWKDEYRKTAHQDLTWQQFLKRKINDPEFKKIRNQLL